MYRVALRGSNGNFVVELDANATWAFGGWSSPILVGPDDKPDPGQPFYLDCWRHGDRPSVFREFGMAGNTLTINTGYGFSEIFNWEAWAVVDSPVANLPGRIYCKEGRPAAPPGLILRSAASRQVISVTRNNDPSNPARFLLPLQPTLES